MATIGAFQYFHKFPHTLGISSSTRCHPLKHHHQAHHSFHRVGVRIRATSCTSAFAKVADGNGALSSLVTSCLKEVDKGNAKRKLLRVVDTVLLCTPILFLVSTGAAHAAADSIRASSFGLEIASFLRRSGWMDEAIVFALATLPVIELRGAIPVGYWMQLKPLQLTVLSVLGNMVPVPLIIIFLKKFASFVAQRSSGASVLLDRLFKRAREKAGPVEEFQWLGLMLFVAVPFPGTGAWSGAIIASILDMPFWSAFTANLVGVILAGLLVNLLVNLGIKYAIATGLGLFLVSTVMWSLLRKIKKAFNTR